MKKRIFAAAMALCLLAGTNAFAQNQKKGRMHKEIQTVEQMAQRKTDRMKEKLNLSEEQTKQVYDFNLQEIKQMQSMREQMRAARQAEAEKMKAILTPEQYAQWQQAEGPGNGHRDARPAKAEPASRENATNRAGRSAKSEVRLTSGLLQSEGTACRLAPFFCRFAPDRGGSKR